MKTVSQLKLTHSAAELPAAFYPSRAELQQSTNQSLPELFSKAEHCEKEGKWGDVVSIYEDILRFGKESLDIQWIVGLSRRSAIILESILLNPVLAEQQWLRVLRYAPGHNEAAAWLITYFLQTDNKIALKSVLESMWQSTGLLDYAMELAKLRMELSEFDSAHQLLLKLDQVSPEDSSINEYLIYTSEQTGDWENLNVSINKRIRLHNPGKELGSLIFKLVKLGVEQLNDPLTSISLIEGYFASFIAEPESAQLTACAMTTRDQWTSLIARAKQVMNEQRDVLLAVHICNALGYWYATTLQEFSLAERWYSQSLTFVPGNLAASTGLIRMYQDTEQWNELEQLLDFVIQQDIGENTGDRVKETFYIELAAVCQKDALKIEKAVEAMSHAYLINPSKSNYLEFRKLLDKTNVVSPSCLAVLEHRAFVGNSGGDSIDPMLKLGQIYEQDAIRVNDAEDVYIQVLHIDSQNHQALGGLVRVYRTRAQWDRLNDTLQRLLSITPKYASVYKRLLLELAQNAEYNLVDYTLAMNSFRNGFSLFPSDRDFFDGLYGLLMQDKSWGDAAEITVRYADSVTDEEEKVNLLYRASELYLIKLFETDSAEKILQMAALLSPQKRETLSRLIQLYEQTERPALSLGAQRRLLELVKDKRERSRLLLQMANNGKKSMLSEDVQERYMQGALSENPRNVEALTQLCDLQYSRQRWNVALKSHRLLLDTAQKTHSKAEICFRLATISRNIPEEIDHAIMWSRRAVEADILHRESTFMHVAWLLEQDERSEAISLLKEFIAALTNASGTDKRGSYASEHEAKAVAYRKLGDIYSLQFDSDESLEAYVQAAQEIDELDFLVMLSERLFDSKKWKDAERFLAKLMGIHERKLSTQQRNSVEFKRVVCLSRQNRVHAAQTALSELVNWGIQPS